MLVCNSCVLVLLVCIYEGSRSFWKKTSFQTYKGPNVVILGNTFCNIKSDSSF